MFFLAAIGLAFASAAACHGAEPETAKPRPNILVIVTDQQFAEVMSCRMGNEFIKTPALDELTSRGAFFTKAYCAFPLCGPSRNSMFSGLYPHRVRWKPVHDHPSHYLGRYLLDAGYETAYSGKSELHAKDVTEHGFETILAPMGVPTRKTALANGGWDAWAASEAIGFIARPHEKPFLLVASFLNPHNVCEWSRRLAGQEGTLDCGEIGDPPAPEQLPPAPANIGPQADEPDGMTLMRRGFQANRLFPVGGYTVDDWRRHRWGYYRMVELVDREIGRVLKALREAGLEDETLVIFTSDHGECAGAHGWNQKSVPYDESTRVPFIVSWKGRTPEGLSEKLINTGIDLVPTVLDAAGVTIPKELPGRSALPLALGRPVADWPDAVVSQMSMSQAGEIDGFKPTMKWWMVRTERYKYCLFSRGQQRESFIDMQADPGEMRNLAADPAHRQALLEHRERLARYGREHDDRHVAPLLADDVKPIPFDMGKQPTAAGAAVSGREALHGAAVVAREFICDTMPTVSCHASTIVETKPGEFVAAWFGGTAEGNPDVGIWATARRDGTWAPAVQVADGVQADGTRWPCWNPVLFQQPGSDLLLFYKVGKNPGEWWGLVQASSNGGRSWSEPTRLSCDRTPIDGCPVGPIKNKPVMIGKEAILAPSSTESAKGWRIHFERSTDGGATWNVTGPVNDGAAIGAIQPSILDRGGGKLVAVGRTRTSKRLFHAASTDGGLTWGEMTLTDLPNPNSGTDAVTLKDGRHALVYNHSEKARSPLNIALSDDGFTWRPVVTLEAEPGEFSYPAIIQAADGNLHVTYTWKRKKIAHVVIDPTKLETASP